MAHHGELAKGDLTEDTPAIPAVDGAAEPATKPKTKKQAKPRKCTICQGKTTAASGVCVKCKKDGKKAQTTKSQATKAEEDVDGASNHEGSVLSTPEPLVNGPDTLTTVAGSSGSSRTTGRRSEWSHPSSSPDTPKAPDYSPITPYEVKFEAKEQQVSASPTPVIRSESAGEPVVEVPISPSNKRSFDNVENDIPKDDSEGSIEPAGPVRKQRKLTSPANLPDDTATTEASALRAFEDAVTAQEDAQSQQLADIQRAQQEQLEAIKSAHRVQLSALSAANTSFRTSFHAVQGQRDYFEGEMEDWKAKHLSLEATLKQTEEDRDEWKAAKEQVDREKEAVEKERDDWKSAKAQVDGEKAAVEQAKEQADDANAQEIARLMEKVEKLRKGKADLIKQLTSGDSD